MKIVGLVVEYNPFHNGHLYHLNKSKEITKATHSVAIMSGNFLQRGEPALFDKFTRAKMAVENGVDLVIELPNLFACQSAEIFSHGAITILNSLNCIDSVCFGSEFGEVDILKIISEVLVDEPKDFKLLLKKYLDEGMLFPTARSLALYEYISTYKNINIEKDELLNILNSSNNILGIEYIKSLIKLNSNIKPYTIKRISASYNSECINSSICSATAIRKSLKNSEDLNIISSVTPTHTFDNIVDKVNEGFNPMFDEYYFDIISSKILSEFDKLNTFFDINEGLENRIYQSVFKSSNVDELISNIKSKRYTQTRIKRILNNILLSISKEDIEKTKDINKVPYIRILAFNDKGREILKKIKSESDVEILNKFANKAFSDDTIYNTLINYDIKSTNIYNLIYYKNNKDKLKGPMDYYISPIYVK